MNLVQLGTRLTTDVRLLSVILNPFCKRRKRHRPFMLLRYTKDVMKRHDVEVGEYTYGIPQVISHPGKKAKIGKFCSIASGVTILLGASHTTSNVSTYPFSAFLDAWPMARVLDDACLAAVSKGDVPGSRGDVIVGNDVWIGTNATILSGVTIGDGAVIAASSVVTRSVEPYAIVAGNPATMIRKRFDDQTIDKLLMTK